MSPDDTIPDDGIAYEMLLEQLRSLDVEAPCNDHEDDFPTEAA